MVPARARVLLAGGGEVAGPLLPVPHTHPAAHVAGALGEAVQLGQALVLGAGGLDTVPSESRLNSSTVWYSTLHYNTIDCGTL